MPEGLTWEQYTQDGEAVLTCDRQCPLFIVAHDPDWQVGPNEISISAAIEGRIGHVKRLLTVERCDLEGFIEGIERFSACPEEPIETYLGDCEVRIRLAIEADRPGPVIRAEVGVGEYLSLGDFDDPGERYIVPIETHLPWIDIFVQGLKRVASRG